MSRDLDDFRAVEIVYPFVYSATYDVKRRKSRTFRTEERNERKTKSVVGQVYAEVPCVNWSDIDAVARWNEPDSMFPERHCIRWNGYLYVAVTRGGGHMSEHHLPRRDDEMIDSDAFMQIFGTGPESQTERRALFWAVSRQPSDYSTALPNEIVDTTRVERTRMAQRCVDDLLVVDNMVWRRTSAIHVSMSLRSGTCIIDTPHVGYDAEKLRVGKISGLPTVLNWSLSEPEMAARVLEANNRRYCFSDLEVLDPLAVAFDCRSDFAARHMGWAVSGTSSILGQMPTAAVDLWRRMRASYEEWLTAPGKPLPEEAMDALRAFATHRELADRVLGKYFIPSVKSIDRLFSDSHSGMEAHLTPLKIGL